MEMDQRHEEAGDDHGGHLLLCFKAFVKVETFKGI